MRALLGEQDKKIVAGLSYYFDEQDRCARVTEAFCSDDLSMGALLAHALRSMQEQLGAVYTEVDILATAPRLLKTRRATGLCPGGLSARLLLRQGQLCGCGQNGEIESALFAGERRIHRARRQHG